MFNHVLQKRKFTKFAITIGNTMVHQVNLSVNDKDHRNIVGRSMLVEQRCNVVSTCVLVQVTLIWTPTHSNITGYCSSGELARASTELRICDMLQGIDNSTVSINLDIFHSFCGETQSCLVAGKYVPKSAEHIYGQEAD